MPPRCVGEWKVEGRGSEFEVPGSEFEVPGSRFVGRCGVASHDAQLTPPS